MVDRKHNNPPHTILELDAGQAEAFEIFLRQRRKEAETKFQMAQAQMMIAASDVELCEQMLMKMHGESVADRYQFKTTGEKLAALHAAQEQD